MDNKPKIKISIDAYNELLMLLNQNDDYSHIRLNYKDGCCGTSKIEILFDTKKDDDFVEQIDELPIVYNSLVIDNIKAITLVYRNSSFMLKAEPLKAKDCTSCTKGCENSATNKGHCSSGCSKNKAG